MRKKSPEEKIDGDIVEVSKEKGTKFSKPFQSIFHWKYQEPPQAQRRAQNISFLFDSCNIHAPVQEKIGFCIDGW